MNIPDRRFRCFESLVPGLRVADMKNGVKTFLVVTANRLRDGSVVYLRRDHADWGWTTDIHHAHVFAGDERESALKAAGPGEGDNIVVGVYAIEIADGNRPVSAREKIRAQGGPTIAFGLDAIGAPAPDYSI